VDTGVLLLGTSIDPAIKHVEEFQITSFPRRRESSGVRRKVTGVEACLNAFAGTTIQHI
jgi:hypothetical protein